MNQNGTLKDLIKRMEQLDRTVDVWVQADTTRDPPRGTDVAARVVDMLKADKAGVVKIDADGQSKEVERGDVIWYELEYSLFVEQWNEARKSLHVGRAMESPVVIQADEVPRMAKELIDVRVVVNEDGEVGSVYRLQRDDFGGEQYQLEMSGLST